MEECVDFISFNSVKLLRDLCNEYNKEEYRKFLNYVFKYHMFNPGQKTLEKESAIVLINIIMKKKHPIAEKFIEFFKQSERKVLNQDQWINLVPLFTLLENKEHYDTSGACIVYTNYRAIII